MSHMTVPDEFSQAPLRYVAQHMAPRLTGPMYDFSKAIYKYTTLSLREFEAARARIAQINGCIICQNFRSASDVPVYLEGLGEDPTSGVHTHGPAPDERLYSEISEWQTSAAYSAREKVVIEFAERYSLAPDALGYDDKFWALAKTHLSEAELYELTIVCGMLVATGRFVHVLGLDKTTCALRDSLPRKPAAAA